MQARIAFASGDVAGATQQLEALLNTAEKIDQQALLHYRLWEITQEQMHKHEAQTRYTALCARTPDVTYQARLRLLQNYKE